MSAAGRRGGRAGSAAVVAVVAALLVGASTLLVVAPALLVVPAAGLAAGQEPAPAERLRIPFPHDDGSLTPYTFELGYSLMTLVYDTLLWRDADGRPQPWLAESVDVADDARQVTVRLREGATWHDGQPVTAADVAFTFDHVQATFHPRFTPQLGAVEAVTATDERTVVVDLAHPSPGFADQPLADLPILPAHRWADLPAGRHAPEGLPVGSGPYRLVAHEPGESYRFEAVEEYFRGAPAVAEIQVPIVRTARDTVRALERRDVDMVPLALPEDVQERVGGSGVRVVDGPAYAATTLLLDTTRPPFDDPAARRGVARSLDLTRIVRAVGDAVPAEAGMLHPASRWAAGEALHDVDEQAAADALAGLDLPALEVLAPDNDPVKVETARQVTLALERAGVPASVAEVSRDELGERIGEHGAGRDFQLAVWSSPPLASYDPDFLRTVFGSDEQAAPLNHTGYASGAFDELARRVATTVDVEQRRAAVAEQLALLARDAPAVPLFFADGAYAYRPAIHDGWTYVKGAGILDKRSFLAGEQPDPGAGEPGSVPGEETPAGDEAPAAGDGSLLDDGLPVSPFALAAVGLLALAGVLVVGSLVRSRR